MPVGMACPASMCWIIGPATPRRVDTFTPDVYAVMDDLAYARAVEDGVTLPSCGLQVIGLAGLASESATMPHSVTPGTLLFVSEPAARDGGVAKRG